MKVSLGLSFIFKYMLLRRVFNVKPFVYPIKFAMFDTRNLGKSLKLSLEDWHRKMNHKQDCIEICFFGIKYKFTQIESQSVN